MSIMDRMALASMFWALAMAIVNPWFEGPKRRAVMIAALVIATICFVAGGKV